MAQNTSSRDELARLLAAPVAPDSPKRLGYLVKVSQCYYDLRQYEEELPYRIEILERSPRPVSYNNLAVNYENLHRYRKVLPLYRRALEMESSDDPSSIIYGNLLRYITRHKTFVAGSRVKVQPRVYSADLSTLISFARACYNTTNFAAFSLTDSLTISSDCTDYSKHPIIKTIFDNTEELQDKTRIRLFLITLYANAATIINGHRASTQKMDPEIGHYTRVENLKSLLKRDEDTYQRLFNVAYMNDPSEGKVFDKIMEGYGRKLPRSVLADRERKGHQYHSFGYSTIYIGSFSASIDSLPMWVQYGNDGHGCCLVFENDFFDEEEPLVAHSKAIESSAISSEPPSSPERSDRYVLYKVFYLSDASDYKYRENLQMIAALCNQLDSLLDGLEDDETTQQISSYIESILDQIRFLFKDSDYEHEHEYRVIKWADDPLCDEGKRSGEVPHLYIEMTRPLRYKEVILGPKVENPSAVAPYLHYTNKVKQITKSSISYQ